MANALIKDAKIFAICLGTFGRVSGGSCAYKVSVHVDYTVTG